MRKKKGRRIIYNKQKKTNDNRIRLWNDWVKMCKSLGRKKANLYLVELSDKEETFLKIGITTTSVTKRFRKSEYRLKKIKTVRLDSKEAFKAETKVLRRFVKKRYYPSKKFSGYTECFQPSVKKEIIAYIRSIK